MSFRLILRHTVTADLPSGVTDYRTFDVDLPQIEALLRKGTNNQYEQYELIGAELLPAAGGAPNG